MTQKHGSSKGRGKVTGCLLLQPLQQGRALKDFESLVFLWSACLPPLFLSLFACQEWPGEIAGGGGAAATTALGIYTEVCLFADLPSLHALTLQVSVVWHSSYGKAGSSTLSLSFSYTQLTIPPLDPVCH